MQSEKIGIKPDGLFYGKFANISPGTWMLLRLQWNGTFKSEKLHMAEWYSGMLLLGDYNAFSVVTLSRRKYEWMRACASHHVLFCKHFYYK